MGILTYAEAKSRTNKAVKELAGGKMIILTDEQDRENEGDLICLAEHCESSHIDFMSRWGRGLICTAMASELVDGIGLQMQTGDNNSPFSTPFTESVDAREMTTTGISANERAMTIGELIRPGVQRTDFSRPGHIFPLRAHPKRLTGRRGHTEGGVVLAELARSKPAAVICEILGADGGMARGKELESFARKHGLFTLSMDELLTAVYRPVETVQMPLDQGNFSLSVYHSLDGNSDPCTVLFRPWNPENPVPVRIHSQCFTGDVLGSRRCDCGEQLDAALDIVAAEGGVVIYLPQEGRGIGLTEKIRAYKLQEEGVDTLDANLALGHSADCRDYFNAVQILKSLDISDVELLTNNPAKSKALQDAGFNVRRRELSVAPREQNRNYLQTKKERMGHLLSL